MFRKLLPLVASIQLCTNGVNSAGLLWTKQAPAGCPWLTPLKDAEEAAYSKYDTKWNHRSGEVLTADEKKEKDADWAQYRHARNLHEGATKAHIKARTEFE